MTDRIDTDPYAEGADAWLSGAPETANPYDIGEGAYLEWNDGWLSMQEAEDDF